MVYTQLENDIKYVTYKQLGGTMIRLDVIGGVIDDVEDYKNYTVEDSWLNGDRMTYYIDKPKDTYTDSTGITYGKNSISVYRDKKGCLRSFSDDTKKHLESYEKSLEMNKKLLEYSHHTEEGIKRIKTRIEWDEKQILKYKKELERGF